MIRRIESDLQRSMQSVNIRVPGLESSMSSGDVNTFPVTSSKWTVSVADGQKLACASVEGTRTSIRREEIIFNIGEHTEGFGSSHTYFCSRPWSGCWGES